MEPIEIKAVAEKKKPVEEKAVAEEKKPAEEKAVAEEKKPAGEEKSVEEKPVKPKKKRKRNKPKPPVGVAGLLDYARIKFSTEEGDFDVEEDEHGTFAIGGEELTFESWSQITKIRDDGVCKANIVLPKQRIKKPKLIYDVEEEPTTSNGKQKQKNKAPKEVKEKKEADKDEGELSDSSASSSSSDDSDKGTYRKANKKRKTAATKKDGAEIFAKAYQYRNALVQHFNLQQKMAFFELLRVGY